MIQFVSLFINHFFTGRHKKYGEEIKVLNEIKYMYCQYVLESAAVLDLCIATLKLSYKVQVLHIRSILMMP